MKKNDLDKLINEAFAAPEPQNKQAFLKNMRPREISLPAMLFRQAAYIPAPVWLFAGGIVLLAILAASFRFADTEYLLTLLMPFSAAISVLETRRSARFGMSELEMATRFSLRSVFLSRMTLFGILAALELCICVPVIATVFGQNLLRTCVHILIPYLVTMVSGLIAERTTAGRQKGYLSLVIASLVSFIVFWMEHLHSASLLRYLALLEQWGIALVALLLALTVFEQWKIIKHVEVFA